MGNNYLLYRDVITTVIKCTVLTGLSYYAFSWLLNHMEPRNSEQKRNAKDKARKKLQILGKNKVKLSEYELLIASNLVAPEDIPVSWTDIAGLQDIVNEIKETVIFPIMNRNCLSTSRLTRPPKGVLLYGPPGCGKTLIAKATAKQAAATFINLDVSMLTDKWYGESQKLVSALFSLAVKLEPCIIFIDEIDALLRSRSSSDHEATAMMKAQFMQLWDGLCTDSDKTVIVMGATNKLSTIDNAIRRRMPSSFEIPLPNVTQRKQILQLILSEDKTENIDYDYLAKKTENFSGSDLKEMCRTASLYRIREFAKQNANIDIASDMKYCDLRPITMEDLDRACQNLPVRPVKSDADF